MQERDRHPELSKKKLIIDYFTIFLGVLATITLFTLLILVYQTLHAGQDARDQILDCTIPEGKCYLESQRRTGEALIAINEDGIRREVITRNTIIAAAACAKEWDAIVLIRQCIEKELEKK